MAEKVKVVKPGIKTSEFWVTLIVSVISLLVMLGVIKSEQIEEALPLADIIVQVAAGVVAALSTGAYAISRGVAKK